MDRAHPAMSGQRPRRLRAAGIALALIALPLAALSARMILGARAEVELARATTSPAQRLRHLRRAMAYYLPGNPWVRHAHDDLRQMARRAEAAGDAALALQTWRELRSAILALRGIRQPFGDELPAINRRIAALTARMPDAARHLTTTAGQQRLVQRLERPPAPHPGWTAVGLGGFVLWVAAALALLLRGLRPDAALTPRFWPLSAAVGVGLLLFVAGMALA